MNLTAAKLGQKFRIPDWHGGYAKCCRPGEPATFEIVECDNDMFGLGQKCTVCGKVVPNDSTFVMEVEPIY